MRRKDMKLFREWFDHYVKNSYSDDPALQSRIRLKEDHTRRVCEKIVRIGQSLNLGDKDLLLAEAVALFHDVGRFRQITEYRTFNDRLSENHALLGLRVLDEAGVLSPLGEEERRLLAEAIRCHNLCDLPDSLPGRHLLFARLIRDADKLDILEVFTGRYARPKGGPDPALEPGLPDTPEYSAVFVENLLHRRSCSYDDIKNRNDRRLLHLSWIYDINFPYTLAEIVRNGYIEKTIAALPRTGDIAAVHRRLQDYVAGQLSPMIDRTICREDHSPEEI
ncbi:MAG: HD domain-containing protein [Peptococcaceae bacterium]|nr:HD domain-containing protein [Peptococcaceae bacterium]